MIVTVFCAPNDAENGWRTDLLEYGWHRAEQPGSLVRLVPTTPDAALPSHRYARPEPTLAWSPHPHTQDQYAGTNLPGAILEWLHRDPIDATLLVLDDFSAFRGNGSRSLTHLVVDEEVAPGQALGTPWDLHPAMAEANEKDAGAVKVQDPKRDPFGLGPGFGALRQIAVNPSIRLPRVTFPVLIHSRDLRKIAARWLELTVFLRVRCPAPHGRIPIAHQLAYTIAAAEYRIAHTSRALGISCQAEDPLSDDGPAPIATFRSAIESPRGEIVWDPLAYSPWTAVDPAQAKPGPGRDVLALLAEKIAFDEAGGELAFVLPRRREGVREARLLDQMLLEIPGQEDSLSLNASASAIWELCDDERTLAAITTELEASYEVAPGTLRDDVAATAESLREAGALDLVDVAR